MSAGPFCNDAACCEKVCAEAPYCCETAWDEGCVFGAKLLCGCGQGTCEGFCGRRTPSGCFCDQACTQFLDCCHDVCEDCPGEVVCGRGSCEGQCGFQGMGGCFCDEACFAFFDCCLDICEVCGASCGEPIACHGYCGGQTPDGCFCDDACFAFSDCCVSVCDGCPVLQNCGGPGVCDAADITGDHVVGGADLGLLLLNWGDCPNGKDGCPGDISFDGEVDGEDLGNLLLNWGECR